MMVHKVEMAAFEKSQNLEKSNHRVQKLSYID